MNSLKGTLGISFIDNNTPPPIAWRNNLSKELTQQHWNIFIKEIKQDTEE